jgi:hypothetical protein
MVSGIRDFDAVRIQALATSGDLMVLLPVLLLD